jgi:mRNA-degrading endonuclease toxin of MazEF toxin-antitoxin module
MVSFVAGQIVIADWRDALPKEPNKRRPAIIVEDTDLFGPNYPNVILVPLTEEASFAIAELSVVIDPTPQNGCSKRCFAIAASVTTSSTTRVKPTSSHILPEQLAEIRQKIAMAIGLNP